MLTLSRLPCYADGTAGVSPSVSKYMNNQQGRGWGLRIFVVNWAGLLALLCVFALSGCVGQTANTPPPLGQSSVRFGHVFVLVEENHNYSDVMASPSMPYLNGLANQYVLASNYYANAHPSIPDYFMLTTGQTLTLIDASTPQTFPVSEDNVVRELIAAGKTWKSY